MNKHFYAIFGTYLPNSAVTNRMLSYLDIWSRLDINVTVVFTEPDRQFSRVNKHYNNIEFLYLWDDNIIRFFPLHKIMLFWYVNRFIKKLCPNDIVYIYGQSYVMGQLLRKANVKIYQERSEHPMVFNSGHWPYRVSIDSYLRDCKRINGLFVISQQLKDYFLSIGVDQNKVHIVNMTVDVARFSNVKKHEQSIKYIAYCGNASNNKDGVDQLIRAFALVNKEFPELSLYIIGQPPSHKDMGSNAVLAEKLGVSNRVLFTGIVPSSDMPQILTDAVLLALDRPDNLQAKYGFPTKLGEYLLTGNPVVVTRVGDIPRFIENGISGMISEPSNPEDFASKIIWLLNHPEEARIIGEKGKQMAIISFNNDIEARKIVDVIFG